MDSPCIKQTVCKLLKIFQYGKYLVAYVLKHFSRQEKQTTFVLIGTLRVNMLTYIFSVRMSVCSGPFAQGIYNLPTYVIMYSV